ncbi:damage-control phosphatase ARMT1 family protein [Methanopyrus sp.]
MRAVPRCVPCVLEIAVNTVERAVPEDRQKEAILAATERVSELYRMEPTPQPPRLGTEAQRTVMRYSEDPDPYREEKRRANERAAEVARELESDLESIEDTEELLRRVAAAAIVGNVIDFAVAGHEFDLDELREEIGDAEFAVFDLRPEDLRGARVLYLCDNAGEIALDRLLIEVLMEELECDVVVAVRGGPIVNDATREDAEQVGITKICDVIDTGAEMLGLLTTEVSEEFAEELSSTDVVISKGQGNFESIPEEPFPDVPVYFLLRAKCEPVAEELGVKTGSNVALRWEPGDENVRRWKEMMGE